MSFFELMVIAVGLSMDAFAIAICKGFSLKKPKFRECLLVGVYFGASQAIMPLIGYAVASRFAHIVVTWDHWIAFVLLGTLGGKMIYDGIKSNDDEQDARLSFRVMLPLAIADSIDALAIGISFAFLQVNIFVSSLLIGVTTLILSAIAVAIGGKFGDKFGNKATIAGGAILILLGTKILIEHLLAN